MESRSLLMLFNAISMNILVNGTSLSKMEKLTITPNGKLQF